MSQLETCSNGHPEIAHIEGWKSCPMCALMREMEDLQEKIDAADDAERRIAELENEVSSLVDKVNNAKYYFNEILSEAGECRDALT